MSIVNKIKKAIIPALFAIFAVCIVGACASMKSVQASADSTNRGSIYIALTDGIAVNYYASLDASVGSATATFESEVASLNATVAGEKDGDLWKFVYTNVTPQYIDQAFTIKVNGEVFVDNYSVAQYCADLQSKTATQLNITQNEYDKAVTVAKDLIYYGQAAKAYKLDGEVTATPGTGYEGNTDNMTLTASTSANGNKIVSATVVFDYLPDIKFGFELPQKDVITVFVNDEQVELTGSGTAYEVKVENIYATSFDEAIKVELKENGATVQTLTYSINDYTARIQDNSQADAKMKTLAQALYSYGKGAEVMHQLPTYTASGSNKHVKTPKTSENALENEILEAVKNGGTVQRNVSVTKQFTGAMHFVYGMVGDGENLYFTRIKSNIKSNVFVGCYNTLTEKYVETSTAAITGSSIADAAAITFYDGKIIIFDGLGNAKYTSASTFAANSVFEDYTEFNFAGIDNVLEVHYNEESNKFLVYGKVGASKVARVYNSDKTTYTQFALNGVSDWEVRFFTTTNDYIYLNYGKNSNNIPKIEIYDWSGAYVGLYSLDYAYSDFGFSATQVSNGNTQGIAWCNGKLYATFIDWNPGSGNIICLEGDAISVLEDCHDEEGCGKCYYCDSFMGTSHIIDVNQTTIDNGTVSFTSGLLDGNSDKVTTPGLGSEPGGASAYGGTYVGNLNAVIGATMTFKVNMPEAKTVEMYFARATGLTATGNIFKITINDVVVIEALQSTGSTGGWHTYVEMYVGQFNLNAGENTIVFEVIGSCGNFDYLNLVY